MSETVDQVGCLQQVIEVRGRQVRDLGGECGDAATAGFVQEAGSERSGMDPDAACVGGVGGDFDQLAAFESSDDAAHGGRLDLFGGGELSECHGPGEDQNREGGQAGGALAGSSVLFAHTAEQVDGGRVEAVGDDVRRGVISWLAFCLAF